MNIIRVQDTANVERLFEAWEETLLWSCLEGTMGNLYAEDTKQPGAAMAMLGDFCFFAGQPSRELVLYKPEECRKDFMIMVPQNEEWAQLITEVYQERATRVTRYAIKKEDNVWDLEKLQHIVASLDNEFELKMIDRELFLLAKETGWMVDFVSQYQDYEQYEQLGMGVVILKDGTPVAGASSYSAYSGGIEIEIDTREDYRRRGLATVCGAKLILECVSRGRYPSWDAQNKWSVALAEKLGYHYSHDYTAFEIQGY